MRAAHESEITNIAIDVIAVILLNNTIDNSDPIIK
jgi:hypothetical protein